MPRAKRWATYAVDPLAVLNDPDFVRMIEHPLWERAQRAYLVLWLGAWLEKEPGVYPYLPRRFAQLVNLTPEQWAEVEPLVRPAFKMRDADGAWFLAAMVMRQDATQHAFTTRSIAARIAAKARWRKVKDAERINGKHADANANADSNANANANAAVEASGGTPAELPADLRLEAEKGHPKIDPDLVWRKVLDDGPCRNVRNKFRNWVRIADERGMDLKPRQLLFGTPEDPGR